ncbi:MAG: S-layer homology domain-containing protein [Firmicutes bacterium]|nr:S-layer homology domain-containing protein [Bacillota bacterium]
MKRRGKLLSILLSLALVVGMIPAMTVPAAADQPATQILSVTWNADYSVTFTTDGTASSEEYWIAIHDASDGHQILSHVVKKTSAQFSGNTVVESADRIKTSLALLSKSGGYYVSVWIDGKKEATMMRTPYRQITLSQISSPTNPHWEGTTAVWDEVPNATTYFVWLYKDYGDGTYKQVQFDSGIDEPRFEYATSLYVQWGGQYYFGVSAVGNGPEYTESEMAKSPTMTVPEPCTVSVLNGAVQSSYGKGTSVNALPGETVVITYTGPQSGSIVKLDSLEFDHWEVTSGGAALANPNSEVTTFVMPNNNVTINGVYRKKEEKANPFVDVHKGDEYYDAVLWAYYATPQITNGIDDTHFGPKQTVTRGQCAAFLWRAMGCPEPKSTYNPFVDVPTWQYYYKPILWAVENGITKGTDETHYSPDLTLKTAHIITFMYRTKNPGKDGWYQKAANWAGTGYGGKPFGINVAVNDTTDCPRCNVVQFLQKAK